MEIRKRQDGISETMTKSKSASQLLLILGIIALLAVPFAGGTECFPCASHHKLSKTENCTNTEDDCEGCIKGLQEYSWTPYNFCASKVKMPYGTITVLWCRFEEEINCIWQKNDFQVDNLQFVGDSNGTNTTNCSIQITVTPEAVGIWDCKSEAEDDKDAIQGSRIDVSLKPIATFTEGPHNATVRSGDNSTLTCIFDLPVRCFWMHNGTRTQIVDRYHFVVSSDSSQKLADCSINIIDFHDEDSGEWRCGCKEDSSVAETVSEAGWLTNLNDTKSNPVVVVHEPAEWVIVLAVVVSIVLLIVVISIVLGCIYGCGGNYKAVSQKEFELGETRNGRPPVLLTD